MKKLTTILAAVAVSATLAMAQGPRGGMMGHGPGDGVGLDSATRVEMRVTMLTKWLTLTDAQKAQATTIFTNAATAADAVHANMQTAHTALSDAVKTNNIGAIDQAANTIGTLTAQLISIESKAEAAFYAILTPDQQTKYDARRGGRGPMGGVPGMGGFGGPRGARQ